MEEKPDKLFRFNLRSFFESFMMNDEHRDISARRKIRDQ